MREFALGTVVPTAYTLEWLGTVFVSCPAPNSAFFMQQEVANSDVVVIISKTLVCGDICLEEIEPPVFIHVLALAPSMLNQQVESALYKVHAATMPY